jgi:hypothetical protein
MKTNNRTAQNALIDILKKQNVTKEQVKSIQGAIFCDEQTARYYVLAYGDDALVVAQQNCAMGCML